MSEVIRFGVSLEKELLNKFDEQIKRENYTNRSEAIRDLIRDKLVGEDWTNGNKEVAGIVSLVYDHHKRDVRNLLEDIQHNFHECVVAAQHVHLDHDNCLETIIVRGKSEKISSLANTLKAVKGVKHGQINMATTGKEIT